MPWWESESGSRREGRQEGNGEISEENYGRQSEVEKWGGGGKGGVEEGRQREGEGDDDDDDKEKWGEKTNEGKGENRTCFFF